MNNSAHLPIVLQRELFHHLYILEFYDVEKRRDMDIDVVKEQYYKLAQKYHPDTGESNDKDDTEEFIKIKDSFDKIMELNKEAKELLFITEETIRIDREKRA